MKKVLISILAAAAVLSSCSVNDSFEAKTPSGKKMTLTASIPSSQTKVVYSEEMTDAGLALKASWSDKDTISVLTLGTDGTIIAIDDFVCEGAAGQTKAVFTGTLSADPDEIVTLTAVYPRMNPEWGTNDTETVMITNETSKIYMYSSDAVYEEEPGEMERLAKSAVLLGKVTEVAEDELGVELQHQFALVKFNITVGEEYAGLPFFMGGVYVNDSELVDLEAITYAEYDTATGEIEYEAIDGAHASVHYNGTHDCSHVVDENGILAFYLMIMPTTLVENGYLYNEFFMAEKDAVIETITDLYANSIQFYGLCPIGKNITLEAGKVYTVSGFAMEL